MTWPAALSGAAALRVPRTVAGRRALRLGLLLGALFLLGFLGGERAQAAGRAAPPSDGTATITVPAAAYGPRPSADGATERGVTGPGTGTSARPGTDTPGLVGPWATAADMGAASTGDGSSATGSSRTDRLPARSADDVLRPVTGSVAGAVGTHVLRPVGDLVESVVEGLAGTGVEAPSLPGLPTSPSLPDLPPVPDLPDVSERPGQVLPAPYDPNKPDNPAPEAPQPGAAAPSPPSAPPAGPAARGRDGTPALAFGPRLTSGAVVPDAAAHSPARRTAGSGPVPSHRASADDTDGALLSQSTTDSGTSRHGDAHAVTLNCRARLPLVPGAAASTDAAGTRDLYGDIPLFPG
ncbi:hypothetical protein [Streptomyces sp. NPDC003697]